MSKKVRRRQRQKRNGTTLIEVMGTLSILLMIGISAASMLGTATSVGLTSTQNSQTRADVARFAQQFRQDVALADEIELPDSDSIVLKTSGAVIRYQIHADANQLTREQIGSSDKLYERYQLTEACEPAFFANADYVTARLTPDGNGVPWFVEVMAP